MKNKYLKKALITISIFFLVILSFKRVDVLFGNHYEINKFLIRGLLKVILLVATILLISKNSFFNWKFIFNKNFVYVILAFLSIYFSVNYVSDRIHNNHLQITTFKVYTYLFNCFATGFFEEFFFRVLIFGYVCVGLSNNLKKTYYKEIFITSFLFAVVHISNLLSEEFDILSVINQIIFAFCVGVFLQSLFYFTKNIIICGTCHALINFFGMLNTKLFEIQRKEEVAESIWSELGQTLILSLFLMTFIVLPVLYFSQKRKQNLLINFESIN